MKKTALPAPTDPLQTLLDAATAANDRCDYASAVKDFEAALQQAQATGNKEIEIRATMGCGNVLRRQDDYPASLATFEQALQIARDIQNRSLIADSLAGRGHALRLLGRHDEALAACEEALAESRAGGDRRATAHALWGKGETLRLLGRHDEALAAYEEAFTESRACSNRRAAANALRGKGDALRLLGHFDEALVACEEALTESRACGDRLAPTYTLSGKGAALRMLGRHDEALAAFEEALTEGRAYGDRLAAANALIGIGETAELKGDLQRSASAFKEANSLGRELGYGYAITRGQAGMRRLSEAAKALEPRQEYAEKPSQAPSGTQPEPRPLAGKTSDHAPSHIENRVVSVFGPDSINGLPGDPAERERRLKSMLPDKRVWTVALMCDIRGYTTAMAQTDPEEQITILNRYLARGTQLIQANGGGVDKYMGDAILGFFLPTDVESPNDQDCAETVEAAIESAVNIANDPELKSLFAEFQKRYRNLKTETFGIGVGLAAGWAKFGEIGASWRREYTLIGRPVNLVARVQAVAQAWEVLGTQECWNKLTCHPENEKFSAIWPDGRDMPVMKGYENDCLAIISRKGK